MASSDLDAIARDLKSWIEYDWIASGGGPSFLHRETRRLSSGQHQWLTACFRALIGSELSGSS